MSKPRVWNAHVCEPEFGAEYIGRPSKWGNPFTIGPDGTRAQVIEKFRESVRGREAEIRKELHGRHLICWCKPKPCHGDVLLEIANPKRRRG